MLRLTWALALLLLATPAVAQGGTVLYPSLTGTALRDAVRADYAPSQVLGYGPARDAMFAWEQSQFGRLRGVYTGMEIVLDPTADPTVDAFSKGINTEHTVPRSLSPGAAESDMHHLFPTRVEANSARANNPFGEIPDAQTQEWFRGTVSQSSIPSTALDEWSESTSSEFEPRDDHKGNAARAVFYHAAIYTSMPASFFQAQLEDLLDWTYQDPADAAEAARSSWVATQQGTENPFVLDSTLARRIWGMAPPPPPGPSVWINEIHYDNENNDRDEGIEIAGPAGTDLAGWSLVLYDGTSGRVYRTVALTGTIADQQAGYGTLWFPIRPVLNGPADGAVLVDDEGAMVQFLSWEGTLIPQSGIAAGQASTDIGVQETNTSGSPRGSSLQLSGRGTTYGAFMWNGPGPGTRGEPNAGQFFGPAPSSIAWINEIHYDNGGVDRNEGLEIAGTAGLSLAGWEVVTYERTAFPGITIPLSGTIPDEGAGTGAVWFPTPLRNYQFGLALVNASGDLVEFLSYEGSVEGAAGPAMGVLSLDIGVEENHRTRRTESLQRLGGSDPGAPWTGPVPRSPGQLNAGQTVSGALVASASVPASAPALTTEAETHIVPNPVRDRAEIVPRAPGEPVRVELFDALGRRVALLHDGAAPARLSLSVRDLAPGVYVVRIAGESGVEALRVTVTR